MYIISSKCVVQIKLTCQNNPSFCHALTSLNRSATFFLSPSFKLLASKKQEGDWASVKFIYRSIPSKEERESLLALPHTFFGWCWQNLHSRTKMFWSLHLNWKGNCINRYLCWEQHSSFYKPIRSTKKDSPSVSTQHQPHSTQAKKQYLPPSSSTILCSFLLATICLVSQCSMSFWMDISTGGEAWWAFISLHSFLVHNPFTSWGAPYSPDPAWCLPLSTLSPQRGGRPRAHAVFWQEPLLSPKRPQYHSYQTTASTSALLVKGARLHTSWDSTHDVIWLMLIWHLTRTHPLWPCFGRTHHFQCMKDVQRPREGEAQSAP